ncbi:hypothetical protein BD769DRAFT_1411466 [Suillus cothurnatus]|nr:hypothetical protein BD769DRAFT_1411466 [Suillus cothurnatus]
MNAADFSTNRHSSNVHMTIHMASKHTDLYFNDGNIILLAGMSYFLVHQGLLARHSEVLDELMRSMDDTPTLEDHALTYNRSFVTYDSEGFPTLSGLLRMLTKYKVHHLRNDILRGLSNYWPTTLTQWDTREASVTGQDGTYTPRDSLPHPIEIINLAREIDYLPLLPSAMYDLTRSTPSEAAIGFVSPFTGMNIRLEYADLLTVLKGREQASRFFSTFIVNNLEGRQPSRWCLMTCQIAFEAITFELLRDINGIISNRTSDPLYAMTEAEQMQIRDDLLNSEVSPMKTCEHCRVEFGAVVDAAKEDFWKKLPKWFDIDVSPWG